MTRELNRWLLLATLTGGAALVCGCAHNPTETRLRLQNDFGSALSQDLKAQIADPDAGKYAGPAPPSSGARADLAQERYRADAVTPPSTIGASGTANGYGNGGSGAGGAGAGAAMGAGGGAAAGAAGP